MSLVKVIGLLLGSILVAAQIAFLVWSLKPGLFSENNGLQGPDSSAAQSRGPKGTDSTTTGVDSLDVTPAPRDLVDGALYRGLEDSAASLSRQLAEEKQKMKQLAEDIEQVVTSQDSVHAANRQALAAFMNSMNAEDAARILRGMTDSEARDVILRIKKRQAGKILSAMDPNRAATMMR